MAVLAITPFKHGRMVSGVNETIEIKVGDKLDDYLTEEELAFHVANGSAIDTSKKGPAPGEAPAPYVDESTRLRDELLAKQNAVEAPAKEDNESKKEAATK